MSDKIIRHYEVEVITNGAFAVICGTPTNKEEYKCDKSPTIKDGYFIIHAEDGDKYISCNIIDRVNCKEIWEEVI